MHGAFRLNGIITPYRILYSKYCENIWFIFL